MKRIDLIRHVVRRRCGGLVATDINWPDTGCDRVCSLHSARNCSRYWSPRPCGTRDSLPQMRIAETLFRAREADSPKSWSRGEQAAESRRPRPCSRGRRSKGPSVRRLGRSVWPIPLESAAPDGIHRERRTSVGSSGALARNSRLELGVSTIRALRVSTSACARKRTVEGLDLAVVAQAHMPLCAGILRQSQASTSASRRSTQLPTWPRFKGCGGIQCSTI